MDIINKTSFLFVVCALSATENLYKGFKGYVDIGILLPGQLRYTLPNVKTKAQKLLKTSKHFNNRQSSLDLSNAIPVILGPHNMVIVVDSHHEYLAAQMVNDTTVPIEIKDDLRNLNKKSFYQAAKALNYIYPYDLLGHEVYPPKHGWYQWKTMQDDPNRLYASITAWKCNADLKCTKDPNASELPLHPLWIKHLDRKFELAFIEFKIATILYQAGLHYKYEWGVNPNAQHLLEFTEHARQVLEEALNQNPELPLDLVQSDVILSHYTTN